MHSASAPEDVHSECVFDMAMTIPENLERYSVKIQPNPPANIGELLPFQQQARQAVSFMFTLIYNTSKGSVVSPRGFL